MERSTPVREDLLSPGTRGQSINMSCTHRLQMLAACGSLELIPVAQGGDGQDIEVGLVASSQIRAAGWEGSDLRNDLAFQNTSLERYY